jgi:uncharacterized protein YkwD
MHKGRREYNKTWTKYIVLCLLLLFPAARLAAQENYADMGKEVLEHINEYRAKKGLKALEMNTTISEAAEEHSKYMGNKTVRINHDGFEERMHGLMKALKPANGAAENVANGQHTAKEVVSMWIASPGHRENIEGDYNLSGIGIYKNKNGVLYFTHIFIKKKVI